MAAVRYSGLWSEKNYFRYKMELESWIHERGLAIGGDPVWARYNSPFTPWFLRRNEILIPEDAVSVSKTEPNNIQQPALQAAAE
ncbi:heme-binding protein [Desulfobulbus alkaliphilus]|uniref:heme-binding protein n=1 Tax=Desulfobulbus alkaliphilus TaxID=869814 RepID=UPI001965314F|nr:heme-binding protein [Desulfobulbus alkaliphilus]